MFVLNMLLTCQICQMQINIRGIQNCMNNTSEKKKKKVNENFVLIMLILLSFSPDKLKNLDSRRHQMFYHQEQ